MLIGGMDNNYGYLDDVEVYAPGLPCHQHKLPRYPLRVVGATGNLAGKKKVVICGGATHTYDGCKNTGHITCTNNAECVTTKGGTKWCFGPKTKDCYTYK